MTEERKDPLTFNDVSRAIGNIEGRMSGIETRLNMIHNILHKRTLPKTIIYIIGILITGLYGWLSALTYAVVNKGG